MSQKYTTISNQLVNKSVSLTFTNTENTVKVVLFQINKVLGVGGQGATFQVHILQQFVNGLQSPPQFTQYYTLKIQEKCQNEINDLKNKKSILVQQSIIHPNIPRLYDWCVSNFNNLFNGKEFFVIVQDFIDFSYDDFNMIIQSYKQINIAKEQVVTNIMLHVCQAVYCLHQKNLAHRDIKPFNILYSIQYINNFPMLTAYLSDFGYVKNLITDYNTVCGTILYMSPQLRSIDESLAQNTDQTHQKQYSQKADCWSIAIVCFELLFGFDATKQMFKSIKLFCSRYDEYQQLIQNSVETAFLQYILIKFINVDEDLRWDIDQLFKQCSIQVEDFKINQNLHINLDIIDKQIMQLSLK